jgi:hypothetical protein
LEGNLTRRIFVEQLIIHLNNNTMTKFTEISNTYGEPHTELVPHGFPYYIEIAAQTETAKAKGEHLLKLTGTPRLLHIYIRPKFIISEKQYAAGFKSEYVKLWFKTRKEQREGFRGIICYLQREGKDNGKELVNFSN